MLFEFQYNCGKVFDFYQLFQDRSFYKGVMLSAAKILTFSKT